MFDERLSNREQALKAIVGVVVALIIIDTILGQPSWVFSVTALIAWSVADFVHDLLEARASIKPVDFMIYSFTIIGASAAGVWVIQHLMPALLLSDQSPNAVKLDLGTKLVYSSLASIIAYVFPNLTALTAPRESFPYSA